MNMAFYKKSLPRQSSVNVEVEMRKNASARDSRHTTLYSKTMSRSWSTNHGGNINSLPNTVEKKNIGDVFSVFEFTIQQTHFVFSFFYQFINVPWKITFSWGGKTPVWVNKTCGKIIEMLRRACFWTMLLRPSLIYFEKPTRKCAGLIEAMLLYRVVRTVGLSLIEFVFWCCSF